MPLADKEKPTNDRSSALPNSPQESAQPQNIPKRKSDTETVQQQNISNKDELCSKCKVKHDYEPLHDLLKYVCLPYFLML